MNYDITIRATITKTYTIDAENQDRATELAHEIFSTDNEDGIDEHYEQDTLSVEVTP